MLGVGSLAFVRNRQFHYHVGKVCIKGGLVIHRFGLGKVACNFSRFYDLKDHSRNHSLLDKNLSIASPMLAFNANNFLNPYNAAKAQVDV